MSKARQLADLGNVYDDGALSNRNMVINGDMQVAQRGTSFSLASNTYTLDRWNMDTYSISGIAGTVSQDTSVVPEGHTSSLKVNITTGGTINAGGYFSIQQFMEGYQVTSLDLGKSTAKDFTISFWVRSSVTGTFGIALRDGGFSNSYGTTYTINSADTWEYKTVTITGPTSGTFSTTNSYGLNVIWSLGADSAVITASNNAWASGSKVAALGQTNSVATTTGATFYLTGVQLEVGDTATPYEHRPYSDQLQACQRFFEICSIKFNGYGVGGASAHVSQKVTKRTIPTATSGTAQSYSYNWTFTSVAADVGEIAVNGTSSTGGYRVHRSNIQLDAEL